MIYDDPRGVLQPTWNSCMQASVATLLGLPLEEVPAFVDSDDWIDTFGRFFDDLGLEIVRHDYPGSLPNSRCLVVGRGNLQRHMVVADHRRIVWDPHPKRPGLQEIEEIWVPRKAA